MGALELSPLQSASIANLRAWASIEPHCRRCDHQQLPRGAKETCRPKRLGLISKRRFHSDPSKVSQGMRAWPEDALAATKIAPSAAGRRPAARRLAGLT